VNNAMKLEALAQMAASEKKEEKASPDKTHTAVCPECGHTWEMKDSKYENENEYED
jgi:uncharacterized Zn ribbon protein